MADDQYGFEITFRREQSLDNGPRWVGKIVDQQTEQSEFLFSFEDAVRFMKARMPDPTFGQDSDRRKGTDAFSGFADDMSKFVSDMAPQMAAFWQKSVDTLSEQASHLQHRMRETADRARDKWDQGQDQARDQMADILSQMQQQLNHLNDRLNDLEHSARKKDTPND